VPRNAHYAERRNLHRRLSGIGAVPRAQRRPDADQRRRRSARQHDQRWRHRRSRHRSLERRGPRRRDA
jgi:hypothetical protein